MIRSRSIIVLVAALAIACDGEDEGAGASGASGGGSAGTGAQPAEPRCEGELAAPSEENDASSFVVLPDTQFYACAYPNIFDSQARWLVDEREAQGIALVLHTGDIVDHDTSDQWQVAADALHELDGVLPYVLAPGNHDLDRNRATMMDRYFALTDLASAGGVEVCARASGRLDNSYAIARLRGEPWLFIGLEFAPRDATLEWANQVLAEHADKPAVLFTHAYLYSDGQRYDRAITPMQPYHPDGYGFTAGEGIADGQDIWESVVEPNENVRLVLSGHVIPDGVGRSSSTRRSGSVVHEVLANYQTCGSCPCDVVDGVQVEGGGGYLRIFHLDEAGAFQVSTYSPYRDEYLPAPENEFELPNGAL